MPEVKWNLSTWRDELGLWVISAFVKHPRMHSVTTISNQQVDSLSYYLERLHTCCFNQFVSSHSRVHCRFLNFFALNDPLKFQCHLSTVLCSQYLLCFWKWPVCCLQEGSELSVFLVADRAATGGRTLLCSGAWWTCPVLEGRPWAVEVISLKSGQDGQLVNEVSGSPPWFSVELCFCPREITYFSKPILGFCWEF